MVTIDDSTATLAVLIDADNAQPAIMDGLLAEIAKYGTAHVKRAYGDWTGTNLRGWKDHLLAQSIQPIQQFAYTTGKSATDATVLGVEYLIWQGHIWSVARDAEGWCHYDGGGMYDPTDITERPLRPHPHHRESQLASVRRVTEQPAPRIAEAVRPDGAHWRGRAT